MPQSVRAIYENGLLRPLEPLRGIAEHSQVKLIVRDSAQPVPFLAECIDILPQEDTEEVVRQIEEVLAQAELSGAGHTPAQRASALQAASFLRLVASLTDLEALQGGWDTYDASPPSALALTTALRILRILYSLNQLPDRILPLADGGAALVYNKGAFYANIECFNDGEVTAGISNRSNHHESWDVDLGAVEDSVKRISAFLNG